MHDEFEALATDGTFHGLPLSLHRSVIGGNVGYTIHIGTPADLETIAVLAKFATEHGLESTVSSNGVELFRRV